MKTTVRIADSRSNTVIVSFLYEKGETLSPKLIAERYLLSNGWKISYGKYGDRLIFDFRVQKGEEFKFCKACLITRFYLTTAGKVGAQGGYSRLTPRQIECGVERIYVFPDGTCSFSLKDLATQMSDKVLKVAHRSPAR